MNMNSLLPLDKLVGQTLLTIRGFSEATVSKIVAAAAKVDTSGSSGMFQTGLQARAARQKIIKVPLIMCYECLWHGERATDLFLSWNSVAPRGFTSIQRFPNSGTTSSHAYRMSICECAPPPPGCQCRTTEQSDMFVI